MKQVRFCLLASGAFVFFLFSSGALAQQLFDTWINYQVPRRPACVNSADIDGDGDLDLVICHAQVDATGQNPVVIMKNDGAGFFRRDTTLHTQGGPAQVIVKDLDIDGDMDILTVNTGANRIAIFKNRGGTSGFELPFECFVGSAPSSVAADLLDGDATPDIITSNSFDGTASIQINHGAATFPAESTKVLGINPRSLVVFDFDKDGDKDFAASLKVRLVPNSPALGINGIVVLENRGNGRFDDSARVFFKIPLSADTSRTDTLHNPFKLIAADFNGDGYPDLALDNSSDTANLANASIFLNVPSKSAGGVFRSTNNGTGWTAVNAGLTNRDIRALAIHSSGAVLAGTSGGGIYRSTDSGGSWTAVNAGLTNTELRTFVINSSGQIFAGTFGGGVFRSTDNGASWTAVNIGLTNTKVLSLAINSSGQIFAGTSGGGVFRSTNNGGSWSVVNTGLANSEVRALAINSSGNLFAGTAGGIFRSLDNGAHWTVVNTGLTNTGILSLAINSGGNLFAGTAGGGVFRSLDNGANWAAVNTGLTNTEIRTLALNPSGDIFAGTFGGGVFRTTDNGANWTATSTGLANTKVLSLAANSGGLIFSGTLGGLTGSSFARPVQYRVGLSCRSIFAADLDGDGDVDIAAASRAEGVVSILKNSGTGTFAPRVDYLTPTTPIWVEGGDFDRDGDIDLAVVSENGAALAILRNKGNGTFETGREFSTGYQLEPFGISSADLEPDGDIDLVIGNLGGSLGGAFCAGQISIHRNNGSGSFPDTATDFFCSFNPLNWFSGSPRKVVIADLDGDLDLDLAACNTSLNQGSDGSIVIFLNSGNGAFPLFPSGEYPLVPGSFPRSLVARDLDGDGDIDLATANLGKDSASVLKNNGNGTFAAPVGFATGSLPNDITAADFDRDGDVDLALTDRGLTGAFDSITVLSNDSSGNFPGRADYLVGSVPTGLDAADFNEDGWPDLAATTAGESERADTAVVVYINNGSGGFLTGVRYLPAPGPAAVVVAADMNQDGHLDIVTADSVANTISIFFNNGDGTFAPAVQYGCGLNPRGLAPADLDGDGDLDLAVTNLHMISNVNNGGFTVLTNLSVGSCFARGDLNGDAVFNLLDVIQEQNCAFLGIGSCPDCTADVNCDGNLTTLDVIFLLRKVYSGIPLPC